MRKAPQLRFPGFEGEWSSELLYKVVTINPKASILPDEFIYINLESVVAGKLLSENKIKLKKAPSRAQRLLQSGDILYQTVRPYQKNNYYFHKNGKYVASTGYAQIRAIGLVSSGKFLYQMIHLSSFVERVMVRCTGTSYPAINSSDLAKIEVDIPGIEEQEKIADFLTAVDKRIELQSNKIEKLQTYKRGLTQKIFTRTLRFKCDDGSDFPEWGEMKLGDLADEKAIKMGRGKVISAVDINNKPGNYPIYSSSVKNNGLFGRCGDYMFDKELISWSVDGGGHFFYRPPHKFSITNVSGFIEVVDSGSVNVRFLAHQLQYLHGRQSFDYTTKAHPSVIRNLYVVGLPTIEEQQKIANFLSQIDEKITLETGKLEELKKFKKALLQRMFV